MFSCSTIRLPRAATGLSALAFLVGGSTAFAQVAVDVQVPYNLSALGTALVSPRGIAVAPDGTVYIADVESASTGRVIVISPSGTVGGTSGGSASLAAAVTTIVPTLGGSPVTLKKPNAVAVDSAGHLYIADIGADKLYEVAAPETNPAATLLTYPGTGPTALATDASDNLYVADTGNAIYKVVGGTATALAITPATLKPIGLAVDPAGNVIFADASSNALYKYAPAGATTTAYLASPSAGAFHFSGAIAGLPIGMGFDPAGNLYVLDSEAAILWEINPTTPTNNYEVPFSSSTTAPGSLAVSNIGNLYISDDSTTKGVAELFYNNNPVNLGAIKAGTNSPLLNVNFHFHTADSGLQQYENVEGDSTGEFNIVSKSGTCTGAVGVCNTQVEANYSSSAPGLRNGVIGFIDSGNNVSAVHVIGTSVAASLALYPGIQNTLSQATTKLWQPQDVAVTGDAHTFFIADEGTDYNATPAAYLHPAVYAYTVSAGLPAGTPTTVGSFTAPSGLALDAFGNLYVADFSGYVSKIPPTYNKSTGATTWTSSGTRLTFPAGITLNHPVTVAVDIYNNLYIGDAGPSGLFATASSPGYIVKVPGNGGPATKLSYVINGTPVIYPNELRTDSFGNLYIADGGDATALDGGLYVVPIATGTATAISFGDFGPIYAPTAVAFDAANDLYVVDWYNERVLVVPITYAGTAPTADTAGIAPLGGLSGASGLTSTLFNASSIVVWPDQNTVSISDFGYQPPSGPSPYPIQVLTLQSFKSVVDVGSGSASVTGINVGNSEIKFLAPGQKGNPNKFSLSGCGAAGVTVEPGLTSACTTTISYSGKGNGQETVTFTLNGDPLFDYSVLGNQIVASATGSSNVPPSGTACNGTYSGIFQGNITVSAGQNCIFVNGGVTGNVVENGGNLGLVQSQVGGNVQINGGTFTLGPGSSIGGNLQIQSLPTGPGQNQVCGTTVNGDLQFQNSGTALLIGSTNPASCAGNNVGGNLQVHDNTAATTVAGNIVGGNLQDNNNTASTQIFTNMVGNNLQCAGDTSITGGGNTAKSKQGQCSTF